MTLTVTDKLITSDVVGAAAEFRPDAAADGSGAWVTDLPGFGGRLLTRDEAILALTAAEERLGPYLP